MDLVYRYDPYQPLVVNRPADSEAAIRTLVAGNERFVQFVRQLQAATLDDTAAPPVVPIDLVSMGLPLLPGITLDQRPFAFVLGCADARVPVERVFDQSFNDLFVVRIAGNVLGTECLGSFDYAARNFSSSMRVALVLGHSGCGAVTGAVDAYLAPTVSLEIAVTHALRSVVDRIMIAVRAAARELDRQLGESVRERSDYRDMLIEAAVYLNAAITAYDLTRAVAAIDQMQLPVAYGVYDLRHLTVRDTPDNGEGCPQLGKAPSTAQEFLEIAERTVRAVVAAQPTA